MVECKSVKYSMESKVVLDKDEKVKAIDSTLFRSLVEKLSWGSEEPGAYASRCGICCWSG